MQQTDLSQNLRVLAGYGKSVADICRRAGVNRTQFNRYLTAEAAPSLQTLRRLCDFFGVEESEMLMPAGEFRRLIRLRPPVLDTGGDPAAAFTRQLFHSQTGPAAPEGWYLSYIRPEPDREMAYGSLVQLSWTGRATFVRIHATYPVGLANLPRRLKFEGLATLQGGKLFCFHQEAQMRRSTGCYVLSVGDFEAATTLDGVLTGTEPESGNAIISCPAVWRYLGPAPDIRAALRQCGGVALSSPQLPEAVRLAL
mgnify:CR=1 FL=1